MLRGGKVLRMLVVCSCKDGRESLNYKNEKKTVERAMKSAMGLSSATFATSWCAACEDGKRFYPQDVERGRKFDVIWFAGCNGIVNGRTNFLDAETLDRFLRRNGRVVMTEGGRYLRGNSFQTHVLERKVADNGHEMIFASPQTYVANVGRNLEESESYLQKTLSEVPVNEDDVEADLESVRRDKEILHAEKEASRKFLRRFRRDGISYIRRR